MISTTFDKYCYVNVRHLPRFFDYSTELSYSRIERVTDVEAIEHPAIREAMKYLDMQEIRLTYEADLPARLGLGTSSSFAVGMLNAFYALKGKYADKRKLADDAIYLERVLCNESGGVHDQIAASFGGLNRINFNADGYEVNPVIISPGPEGPVEPESDAVFHRLFPVLLRYPEDHPEGHGRQGAAASGNAVPGGRGGEGADHKDGSQ